MAQSLTAGGAFWGLGLTALLGSIAVLMRAWSVVRKVEKDADLARRNSEATAEGALRKDLMAEVAALRAMVEQERRSCDERIERIEARHEAALASMELELQVQRHDRNNLKACFDALLMLTERHPEKIADNIAAVKEMRAKGEEQIAVEKAAIPITKARRR